MKNLAALSLLVFAAGLSAQPAAGPAQVQLYAFSTVPLITELGRLESSQTADSQQFGDALDVSGDGSTLAIGAPAGAAATPSVYIYIKQRGTWLYQATLQSSDFVAGDSFGNTVSLSEDGNYLAVGAYLDDNSGGTDAGSVYIFTRSGVTWSQQTRLQASDAAASDRYGWSVSLSGDAAVLAVGAVLDDNSGGVDAGSAYAVTRSGTTWTQAARMQASDAAAGDQFGYAAKLSGDGQILAIGAPRDDNSGGADAGSGYIFVNALSWAQQARLQASDAAASDLYGSSVSVSGDGTTVAFGAIATDNGGVDAVGAAYVSTRDGSTWLQQARLQPADAVTQANFGNALDLTEDGNRLAVGAPLLTDSGVQVGGAFVFNRAGGGLWSDPGRRLASNGAASDEYGSRVAMSDNGATLAIAAIKDDTDQGTNAGSVYVHALTNQVVALKGTTSGGELLVNGAVEIKNATSDDRATVSSDGRVAADANLQIGNVDSPGGAGAASASTPRTISASDDPAVTALQVIDDWDETDRAKVNPIVGQAGITAGAGVVAANTPRVTHASDDPGVTSLAVIDDWDETDRAKVNPIVGQAGVAGGSGAASATTQRVTIATDDVVTVDGAAADGAAVSGNPVRLAGKDSSGTTQDLISSSIGAAGVAILSGRMLDPNAGETLTVKTTNGTAAFSGDNVILAAVTGKKIRVVSYSLQARGTAISVFQDNATATNRSLAWSFQDREGAIVAAPAGAFLFETGDGVGLDLNLSAAVTVAYELQYVEVE